MVNTQWEVSFKCTAHGQIHNSVNLSLSELPVQKCLAITNSNMMLSTVHPDVLALHAQQINMNSSLKLRSQPPL